jgi:hypothetical protein
VRRDSESQIKNSDKVTRREFGQAGSLGMLGIGLAGGLPLGQVRAAQPRAAAHASFVGKAKSVIVLFLYGAPSQMDTLDPKPEAPEEVRGEFKAIRTSLPGILACEHLPKIANSLHRTCLLRSMTHTSNNHAVSVALSGLRESLPVIEGNGNDPRHQPYFGSVLEYLWKQQGISMEATGIPVNMVLPWALNAKTDPGRWQHHAAWLGRAFNPVIPLFQGQGTLEVGSPSIRGATPILTRFDPWDGVTPTSRFDLDGLQLPAGVPSSRLDDRRRLLASVERPEPGRLRGSARQPYDHYRDHALAMIANPVVARALDVTREPQPLRERYGLNLFAQSALAARRLIEVGVKVVTVFWDTWIDNNAAWDTHYNHHPRLKEGLCPKLDQLLPAFLDDMETRGLLDETLVLVISEHGRTPAITNTAGGGREHWAGTYWGLFFGAGIKTGQVIGATDRHGAYPVSRPTHPNDILATVYHLLGFDPHATTTPNRLGQPMPVLSHGEVVSEMLD